MSKKIKLIKKLTKRKMTSMKKINNKQIKLMILNNKLIKMTLNKI
jgi:hypothetical protein